jgi:hypothetical protein
MTLTDRTDLLFTSAGRVLGRYAAGLRTLAPYAAIELLLPGGSLIALALWFFQGKRKKEGADHYEPVGLLGFRGQPTFANQVCQKHIDQRAAGPAAGTGHYVGHELHA